MKEAREIMRGDIFYIFPNDTEQVGSEQRMGRPGLVVSNDKNNHFSSVIEVVYITKRDKKKLPTHVRIDLSGQAATVLCEQVDSVSVRRFGNYMGHLEEYDMKNVNTALKISLSI